MYLKGMGTAPGGGNGVFLVGSPFGAQDKMAFDL